MRITSVQTELVILSPANARAPREFQNSEWNRNRYDQFLAEMQRLRGSVYLRDGAIQADELTPEYEPNQ